MNDHDIPGPPVEAARPRLLHLARETIRRRHYSYPTEQAYLHWMKRFILFSGKRHPRELGATEVTAFLNHLVLERRVAAATQIQALAALLFLYQEVLVETLPRLKEGDALLYVDRALIHEGSSRVRVERGVSRLQSLLLAAAHCIERHEGERKRDGK